MGQSEMDRRGVGGASGGDMGKGSDMLDTDVRDALAALAVIARDLAYCFDRAARDMDRAETILTSLPSGPPCGRPLSLCLTESGPDGELPQAD